MNFNIRITLTETNRYGMDRDNFMKCKIGEEVVEDDLEDLLICY